MPLYPPTPLPQRFSGILYFRVGALLRWPGVDGWWDVKIQSHTKFNSRWYLRPQKSPFVLHPTSQKFPHCCLWNGFSVHLVDDGPLLSFQGRSCNISSFHARLLQAINSVMSLALCLQIDDGPLSFQGRLPSISSFSASLLQVIDGVMSLALCPLVVFQALQHFRSSEKQATCEGCFACQSVCWVISLHSGMSTNS